MTNTTIQTPKSTRCRRDANCTCETCLASINATLDLMPTSLTKHSFSKPLKSSPPVTPLFFNPSTVSTPRSETGSCLVADLTKRSDFEVKIEKKKMGFRYGLMMMNFVVVLCLALVAKYGVEFVGERVLKTKLSGEIARDLGERAVEFDDIKEKLLFFNSEIGNLVQESSVKDPKWEIVKDGLILRSRCQLYKSGIEEVSIWGWPLQTAGLLTTEFDSRSFTILSGRVTEWSNGELSCSIRKANTSWEQGKWSSSVWRLDEDTWILEYKRSFVFEKTRPFWSATEFVKFKMMKAFQQVKDLRKSIDGNYIAPT
ncbi:ERG2/sigma1 receptor-like protein [Tanacetum coccineum]|uniref:ERG2/sigma1 receptor-like protein n=1 Tax=Tanacetum coccineum TaxID=301880 RepID=A0ABQ5ADQ9_9ASTR